MSKLLKISEFSQLSGISRKALIFYDDIGLLKPKKIEENGYRYYSYQQVYLVSTIDALKELGMPLKEIKEYISSRTPDRMLAVFEEQQKILEKKLERLYSIRHMIATRIKLTRQAAEISLTNMQVLSCPEEIFFASPPCRLKRMEDYEKAIIAFYENFEKNEMTYGYPIGTMLSKENLANKEWELPYRFFFRQLPDKIKSSRYIKPAGSYLIAYCQTGYNTPTKIYQKMADYIEKNSLQIAGCSYEEFLLDEVCVEDSDSYILQISIQVTPI